MGIETPKKGSLMQVETPKKLTRQAPLALTPYSAKKITVTHSPSTNPELVAILGSGGQGDVYAAYYKGQAVAVKVYDEADPNWEQGRDNELLLNQLIEPHYAIMQVVGYGDLNCPPHLVMEYVPGIDLFDVAQDHSLTELQRVRPVYDAARALAYLHKHGLVHCDIKPENIMRTKDGRGKLVDPGMLHRQGTVFNGGDLRFSAPEVFEPDAVVNGSRDTYSLALTMYGALVGGRVWPDELDLLAAPRTIRPAIPNAHHSVTATMLFALAQRMWAHEPTKRPAMADVALDIKRGMHPEKYAVTPRPSISASKASLWQTKTPYKAFATANDNSLPKIVVQPGTPQARTDATRRKLDFSVMSPLSATIHTRQPCRTEEVSTAEVCRKLVF